MSTRVVIGIISFCIGMTGMFIANIFLTVMIGEINRKRQNGKLVSYFSFTFPKMLRIFREYRSSYSDGNMHIYTLAAYGLMLVGFVGVAVGLGIIG